MRIIRPHLMAVTFKKVHVETFRTIRYLDHGSSILYIYTREKKHFIKWKKGDIGISEKAHKQDTSQTQQPHSTNITSAPTSPFQHKSRSTTTSHIQSMLLSQPLHSHPKQKSNHSYSNKITIQIFNNNYDSVCMH